MRMHWRLASTGLALAGMLALAGCGAGGASWRTPGSSADKGNQPKVTINGPTDGAGDVPAAVEITYSISNASDASVTLTDASGAKVAGALRPDHSSWVPDTQLKYGQKYTVAITATGDGKPATKTTSFTVMDKPANLATVHSWIGDDQVVGVGMPLVLSFGVDVPENMRASIQKRLFVTSSPAQEGIWNWLSASEVHYRPKDYWQPGTKITMRAATVGSPSPASGTAKPT